MTEPVFEEIPNTQWFARTWTDPVPKRVVQLRQTAVGPVICPHCRGRTAVHAEGILPVLARHNATARNKWYGVGMTCNLCSGSVRVAPSTEKPGMLWIQPQVSITLVDQTGI
jgi:hypothetical protein